MTEAVVVHTNATGSHDAGCTLGWQIAEAMEAHPDVVILFASPIYDHPTLLLALKQTCHPVLLLGCSSAGEFTSHIHGEGLACAVALHSPDMRFTVGIGRDLSVNRQQAAQDLVSSFQKTNFKHYPFRSALILADVLAGRIDDLIEHLTQLTAGNYQFFGGGAGDNAQFRKTSVFYETEVISDAVVALEILSKKPLGVGVYHGWRPASQGMRVTETSGLSIVRLDDKPAVEVVQAFAEQAKQSFDVTSPLPFFLHNVIGIDLGVGYKIRVPLSVTPNGSIVCAADIPCGATIRFMRSSTASATDAAKYAVTTALQRLYGAKPSVALFFDCVATRLKMGKEFGFELEGVQQALGPIPYVGCNTHGQVARVEGQFSGFHNCTAVVCLIPE